MVVYEDPKDSRFQRWYDYNRGKYDIWYDDESYIHEDWTVAITDFSNRKPIPDELADCLKKIRQYLREHAEGFKSWCPVKHEHIDFIYKDEVYTIDSGTFGLGSLECLRFMSSDYFSSSQATIREMLEEELGIKISRFDDFID